MHNPLFRGPASLRHKGERLAFVLTLLFAFPAAAVLGIYIHESVGFYQVALFIVIAMVYVTLARGRLIGSSLRIHEAQHPELFATVKRACAALEIAMPFIFVRDDPFVPVVALGFGEPYSLVFSSHWIGQFQEDELAFLIGRELGHIASGHTRYLSLLSVNGRENVIIAMIFGAWLRRCDVTCDRIGLLVCGSLDAAMRALAVSTFQQHFGRTIDIAQFEEQATELKNDAVLRWGEWLGSEPYATKRFGWLRQFMHSHSYQICEDWFLREVSAEPPSLPAPGVTKVIKADCASIWRRLAALTIDTVLIVGAFGAMNISGSSSVTPTKDSSSSVSAPATHDTTKRDAMNKHNGGKGSSFRYDITKGVNGNGGASKSDDDSDSDTSSDNDTSTGGDNGNVDVKFPFGEATDVPRDSWIARNAGLLALGGFAGLPIVMVLYMILLVGLTAQSFGMMITGLRIVTTDYHRPSFAQTIWRYVLAIVFWWLAIPLGFFSRILLYDKWSGTRLITTERVMARVLKLS